MAMVASSKEERVRFRFDPSMSRRTRRPQIIPDNTDTYSLVQDDLPSPFNSSMGEEEEEEEHVTNANIDKNEQNTTMEELVVSDQNNEEVKTLDMRTEPQDEEEQEEKEKEKEEEKEKESGAYALVIVPKHGSGYAKDKNRGMLKRYIKVLDYMLKANRGSKKKLFASK